MYFTIPKDKHHSIVYVQLGKAMNGNTVCKPCKHEFADRSHVWRLLECTVIMSSEVCILLVW